MTLVGLLEKALKMEGRKMKEVFEDGLQSVRMTYYPPCPKLEQVIGLKAHSNSTLITILNQVNGMSSLQVKKNGVWLPVNFLPNSLDANVGDILEIIQTSTKSKDVYMVVPIMSNGVNKSPEHKATVNIDKERISMVLFFLAKLEAEIGPAKSLINLENPPLFKTIGLKKYLNDFFSRKQQGKSFLEYMRIKKEHVTTSM